MLGFWDYAEMLMMARDDAIEADDILICAEGTKNGEAMNNFSAEDLLSNRKVGKLARIGSKLGATAHILPLCG